MTNPKPSRKRRKIALAAVVLVGVVGWLVAWPAYQRHRMIVEIERMGGAVGRETSGPQWLRQWGIGFNRVVHVHLQGTEITDDGLKHISSLTKLNFVNLSYTEISDEGLKHRAIAPKVIVRIGL